MKQAFPWIGGAAALAALVLLLGCENTLIGERGGNLPPEVWLSSGPVEGDTTGYQVHFYWGGWDPDGEVRAYEFVVAAGNPFGFNPEDTTGIDKWMRTTSHDSVFRVSANDTFRNVTIGNTLYTRYDKTHTFFLRAVDMQGKRSIPVYRSFTAWTLAPFIIIDRPRAPATTTTQSLSRIITFGWTGRDPIDSPDNVQDPDSVRWLYSLVLNPQGVYDPTFDIVQHLNARPERYESKWGPWVWYRAPGDSGRITILGDDEVLEMNRSHIFAVQAKDEAGAVTGIFDRRSNVRQFIVSQAAGPLLSIFEPFLGGFRFLGTSLRAEKRDLPPGVTLKFRWEADASSYGGQVVCYQYGWDVSDLNNPDDWDSDCSPFVRGCSETWYSGVHTLFVRVVDNAGTETLGQIEINVVPFRMDRNLLWVDDFPSSNFTQADYAIPTETEHDNLWLGFCNRAIGFDPTRDVYDAYYNYNSRPPLISLIGRYKNIIWTYSSAPENGAWDDVIKFIPESQIGTGSQVTVNYLSLFLAKGGHLLTEGNSERVGGLAAGLLPIAQVFPMSLKCEITGNTTGCEGDTSGVNSYAYKDYCVSMLDKIVGGLRTEQDMPTRRVRNYDCMIHATRTTDAYHDSIPGFPAQLDLWSEVTAAGRFFDLNAPDPRPGGFTLAEIYDPKYWMDRNFTRSQPCFHPIYRMRSKNTLSALNNTAISLFVTKYENIEPDVESGLRVAAPSFHFGFELWYFNRSQINDIINTIFREWQILAE
jgi:hypothetical protein